MTTINERIVSRAKELGITQAQIARESGVSKGSVSLWFKGDVKPDGENTTKLARALKTTTEWLIYGKDNKNDNTLAVKENEIGYDLSGLMSKATPRTHSILEKIQIALESGNIQEADLQLLETIAERLMKK